MNPGPCSYRVGPRALRGFLSDPATSENTGGRSSCLPIKPMNTNGPGLSARRVAGCPVSNPKARSTVNHLSRRASRIMRQAKAIAREGERGFVGTEHLLLAIIREDAGVAAHILRDHKVTEKQARAEVDQLTRLRMHDTCVLGSLPGTPHLREVLSAAVKHARDMGGWAGMLRPLAARVARREGLDRLQGAQVAGSQSRFRAQVPRTRDGRGVIPAVGPFLPRDFCLPFSPDVSVPDVGCLAGWFPLPVEIG